MVRWPEVTCVLICILAISCQAAGEFQVVAADGPAGELNNKFTCTDTDGKRPGCNGTCPDSCPKNCIVLCPKCLTYCPTAVQMTKPALFVFGDGELDVGNNNYLPGGAEIGEPMRANKPYYGFDFPNEGNQQPTGRFSNGKNTADFIANYMGFQYSPPAYKSLPNPSPTDMASFTGVNYACGMAGIRSSTNAELTFSLPEQLKYFNATRAQMEARMGHLALHQLLSKSLFLIWVGTMDLLPGFYPNVPPSDRKNEVQSLVGLFGDTITALHNEGARKFAIINLGLIGCGPTRHAPGSSGGCDESMNTNAAEFNGALKLLMVSLSSKLQGLRYSIADFNAFSTATFADPEAAGFADTNSACCRLGCSQRPCDNRSTYWFWDEGYMTQQAAMVTTSAFYNGPANYTTPVNFKELIQNK